MKQFLFFVLIFFATDIFSQNFSIAAQRSKTSVIYISVYASAPKKSANRLIKTGYGSGTIISSSGYVVTNFHVVNKGERYQATLYDGTDCEFELMSNGSYFLSDPESDVAVMKLSAASAPYESIPLGDSSSITEGEPVLAIGNPYGLRHSVTAGIISSTGRYDIGFAEIEDFIQTDVPINPGNSGGPLVNLRGEMIGLNSAIRTVSGGYQGISFAIPSQMIEKIAGDLLKYGRVRRGWIGIIVREERSRESERNNVRVVSVATDSPAYAAGIRKGDIVREADGKLITSKGNLVNLIKNRAIGTNLSLVISRSGVLKEITLPFEEKKSIASNLLENFSERYGISVEAGDEGLAVVSGINRVSPNAFSGVKPGDTIRAVNGVETPDIKSFIRNLKKDRMKIRSLEVQRDTESYIVELSE